MLDGHVLVLNRLFQAVQITSVRRALTLLYKGQVRAVDSEYRTYDFENWMDIPVQPVAVASRLGAAGLGVLVGATALSHQRQLRSACAHCGRTGQWTAPSGTPRWAWAGAYAAVGGCMTRLVAQYAVGWNAVPYGANVSLLVFETLFVLAGTVLPLGLVHRDVSPQNVLLSVHGDVKLGDFGVAQLTYGRARAGSLVGKVPYMAPEQLAGRATDRRVDIWAAGVLLYELCTGTHPFRGPTRSSTSSCRAPRTRS